jgi:hypothetical protein
MPQTIDYGPWHLQCSAQAVQRIVCAGLSFVKEAGMSAKRQSCGLPPAPMQEHCISGLKKAMPGIMAWMYTCGIPKPDHCVL